MVVFYGKACLLSFRSPWAVKFIGISNVLSHLRCVPLYLIPPRHLLKIMLTMLVDHSSGFGRKMDGCTDGWMDRPVDGVG
jgi:hypothetical protein